MPEVKDTFVLLPAFTRNEKSYRRLMEQSPKDCSVVFAPQTEVIPSGRIEELLVKFPQFLASRGIDKAKLIGHSVGGAMALEFAMHHPESVQGLYLIDSSGVFGKENFLELLRNSTRSVLSDGIGSMFESLMEGQFTLRLPLHYHLGVYAHRADLNPNLKDIPVTILWGEKDILNPLW